MRVKLAHQCFRPFFFLFFLNHSGCFPEHFISYLVKSMTNGSHKTATFTPLVLGELGSELFSYKTIRKRVFFLLGWYVWSLYSRCKNDIFLAIYLFIITSVMPVDKHRTHAFPSAFKHRDTITFLGHELLSLGYNGQFNRNCPSCFLWTFGFSFSF